MKYNLHLHDCTEPLVLVLGPMIFFAIRAFIMKKGISWKWDSLHFVVPIAYAISQIGYYNTSLQNKYNFYINAYHPELDRINLSNGNFFIFSDKLKSYFSEIVIVYSLFYLCLGIKIYWDVSRDKSISKNLNRTTFTKYILLSAIFAVLIVTFVFTSFQNDLGNHFISLFLSFTSLALAGFLVSESRFFNRSWLADKYETSGLNHVSLELFTKIDNYVKEEKYYLSRHVSLKDLAKIMKVSPNYISQAVNKEKSINFNEYINSFRINEAISRMQDEKYKHYKLESIGESVGFNAKTTFYAAFKKQIGQTPSAYLKSLQSNN